MLSSVRYWNLSRVTAFAQKFEDKLTWPVIIAALASIPAVFLTIWNHGEYKTAGIIIGWATGIVLMSETALLILAAENKKAWLFRHKWLILVTFLTILTLVLSIGGAQILRLATLIGSMRFLRARRIWQASSAIQRQFGVGGWLKGGIFSACALMIAVFVALVLSDPTGVNIEIFGWLDQNLRIIPVALAGAILAFATWIVARRQHPDRIAPIKPEVEQDRELDAEPRES